MRSILSSMLLACIAIPAAADPIVVELYTSQGCSSCPPADAMLGELAGRDDVIALSFHVDYWDWIGWADTFADPAFSDRQRAYAAAAGANTVYTPQFIVGGAERIEGAAGLPLATAVDAHAAAAGDLLRVASTAAGREVVAMPAEGARAGGRLLLVSYLPEATVRILHGENAGRDVTYHNVVRGLQVLASWSGAEMSAPLPPAAAGLRQAVFAQAMPDGRPGAILGAVRLD